jgi:ABC-2 type transport system permease protein
VKLWRVFWVSLREQLRSPWDLLMVLAIAPMFIWMYWSFVGGGSTYYKVLVLNQDQGRCPVGDPAQSCGAQALERLAQLHYDNGDPLLKVLPVSSRAEAEKLLRERSAAALLIFAPDFTAALSSPQPATGSAGPQVTFVGDLSNPYYSTAAVLANATLESYLREVTGQPSPVQIAEEPLGGSATRTEFEIYVPGLLIAAGTMMLFSVAIAVTRQIESGVIRRLQLTRLTAFDLLGGTGLLYLLISLVSVLLSFWTAQALGFRSQGPIWVAIWVCILTGIAVIGVGLLTACFSGTVGRAAIIVNFPLLLLLFFSGAVFPLGDVDLFTLGGRTFGLFDLLPQTHAVIALNKIASRGAGGGDVAFELVALSILTALYFAAGVWLFNHHYLSAR